MSMTAVLLINLAIFAGAVVSGLAGFAFSAVAGAILLHILPPTEAVPLMMVCSIGTQTACLVTMRASLDWKGSTYLVMGGLPAIPLAVYVLQTVDTWTFRIGFGILVAAYAGYMLFRPAMARVRQTTDLQRTLVGFAGGLVGGITAMPGAIPTIWSDLNGLPKNHQRALVQPFILAMQIFALALMVSQSTLSSKILLDAAISLPALVVGTALGIAMFYRTTDLGFRRAVLGVLFFSGLALAF
jgi:uncharacterized membrane protein YfcA